MNELIDEPALRALHAGLSSTSPGARFPALAAVATRMDALSLRQRTDRVAAALVDDLSHFDEAAAVFRRALELESFAGWTIWPVTEAATTLALETGRLEEGLGLLAELTPRLTSEFAIRRLIAHDPDRAVAVIRGWTTSPDEHVRRLASEGTRPYLPWAIRLPQMVDRPELALPILHALHADESDSVRRSVANHLNDIARHAPDLVVETALGWSDSPWVVRHGLRTLVKRGHPGALAALGFSVATVTVGELVVVRPTIELPGSLEFSAEVTNTASTPARLAVDYVVHYRKASGSLAPKVFKLTVAEVAAGETLQVRRRHALRQMTTRVHHPGMHELELQVNGVRYGRASFEVVV